MKAVCWMGINKVETRSVPDPAILNPRDAIVRVKAATLCGSDLHLYEGQVAAMAEGDIIGHEFMGEVVDLGPGVKNLRAGDRVVVPANIGCGGCFYCKRGEWSLCDNSNPNARLAEVAWGHSPCGFYGSSHLTGGYAGAFAEYVRVPFADVGPRKVPDGVTDEQAVFCSDSLPAGYMAADLSNINPGDTVAVWGAGAMGQFAMKSAKLLGAERVIAIDRVPERLQLAKLFSGAEPLDFGKSPVLEALKELTGGRGPDSCIDAVGMEAPVLREATLACRKGGVLTIMGTYGGAVDPLPIGAAVNKGLTFRMGQVHAHRYLDRMLQLVSTGKVDPAVMVTHRLSFDQAAQGFELFKHKSEHCVRVVFHG